MTTPSARRTRPPSASDASLTSREVAKLAGVSQSTVSRVINDVPGVTAATRDRVRAVVEEHGYRPNAAARSLITRRTQTVGVLTSDITNFYYPALLDQFERSLRERGYRLVLVATEVDAVEDGDAVRMLMEHGVDGVVFASPQIDSPAVADLAGRNFPVVLVNRYVDDVDVDRVVAANVAGAQAAVEHLIELGHRRIGYVAGLELSTTDRDRRQGYDVALRAAKLPHGAHLVARGDFGFASGEPALGELLDRDDPPTAVLCSNDMMAFGALHGALARGLSVPREISIVGFDDVAIASARFVDLTTVRQPIGEMASRAVDLLLKRIEEPERPTVQVEAPVTLIVRGTTGPPARR